MDFFLQILGDLGLARPAFVKAAVDQFHYLHFSLFSFLLSGLVGAMVSLGTEPITEDKLYRLTFWTRWGRLCEGWIQ